MNRVEEKYGPDFRASLAHGLWHQMDPDVKDALDTLRHDFFARIEPEEKNGKSNYGRHIEESVGHLINYVNNPQYRAWAHQNMEMPLESRLSLHDWAKRGHRSMLDWARGVNEKKVREIMKNPAKPIAKSEPPTDLRKKDLDAGVDLGGDFSTIGGTLSLSEDGVHVWDMSHLLSTQRRSAGERLHVHEGDDGASRRVLHLRVNGDARVPVGDWGEDDLKKQPEGVEPDVHVAARDALDHRRRAYAARIAARAKSLNRILRHVRGGVV